MNTETFSSMARFLKNSEPSTDLTNILSRREKTVARAQYKACCLAVADALGSWAMEAESSGEDTGFHYKKFVRECGLRNV